jgi:site-specific recombinase XerD
MKKTDDALVIARRISEFLCDYAPQFLTSSEHTLKGYKDSLVLYFQFLQDNGVSPGILRREHLEKACVEKWIVWLKDTRQNCPDTCNNRLASFRRFLEYLAEKDISMSYLYQDAQRIKRQKCVKKKVSGLTRDAVTAILAAPNTNTRIGRRDLVFLTLLYATAARLDEIRSIKLRDVHLDAVKPYISLHGKGQKIRTAYLLSRAVVLLKAYIKETYDQSVNADALLFPSRVNGHEKLTEAALDKRIKIYAAKANSSGKDVPLNTHAHLFRHAKASHWIEDGLSIVEVQFLLGHEQIETTMKYLDITTEEKVNALATIENETEKAMEKKWKSKQCTLVDFCGLQRSNK